MKRIFEHVIPPKLGFGLIVKKGQTLRIIDLEGKQVVDMALFNADNPREKLSTSNSRADPPRVLLRRRGSLSDRPGARPALGAFGSEQSEIGFEGPNGRPFRGWAPRAGATLWPLLLGVAAGRSSGPGGRGWPARRGDPTRK
jgi:hypothetical protein